MIYKFIDNNGSEITVSSLSSLESLIESDTVKENTQVKEGLRGKWTAAGKIEVLKPLFNKKVEKVLEPEIPEEHIKDFIVKSDVETIKKEEQITKTVSNKTAKIDIQVIAEKVKENKNDNENEIITDTTEIMTDAKEQEYQGLNIMEAVKTCFKKYFNFSDRASRSEYWFFFLFYYLVLIVLGLLASKIPEGLFLNFILVILGIFFVGTIIPFIAVVARRLHDVGKTGWFQLLPLPFSFLALVPQLSIFANIITIVLYLYILVLLISLGEDGDNHYGSYPLKKKSKKN